MLGSRVGHLVKYARLVVTSRLVKAFLWAQVRHSKVQVTLEQVKLSKVTSAFMAVETRLKFSSRQGSSSPSPRQHIAKVRYSLESVVTFGMGPTRWSSVALDRFKVLHAAVLTHRFPSPKVSHESLAVVFPVVLRRGQIDETE